MTPREAFDELLRRCEPTPVTKEQVSERQQYLRGSLSEHLDIVDDFLTGSYVRQTQIRPASDIDLFVVWDPAYWDRGVQQPRQVLTLLLRSLRKTYPFSTMRKDGQAVTVAFKDRMKFDVVPAYSLRSGNYIIPNVDKGEPWIQCNPKAHIEAFTAANKRAEGRLKPLIKIVKAWRANAQSSVRSFHLELMVAKCFSLIQPATLQYLLGDYTRAACYTFHELMFRVQEATVDEVNRRVDTYLDLGSSRSTAWEKLRAASHLAESAYRAAAMGQNARARILWKRVFGEHFPGGTAI
jgi:predicted nucleotidyltransferase